MERETSEGGASLISGSTDDCVAFSDAETVAKSWMVDFLFISVCHYFKEDKHAEFNQSLRSLEAMIEGPKRLKKDQEKNVDICCFLLRIVNGKQLDAQFESDKRVTPLMSALPIWDSFSDLVADRTLYENIKNLLFIQSAGVCLEQGNGDKASWVLQWLMEECQMPENLKMKLSVIVNKKDAYHKFLVNFSFNRLVESVKTFVDSFLNVHPFDFLLKAASKVVWTCREAGLEEEMEDQNGSGSAVQHGEGSKNTEDQTETSASAANENQTHEASTSVLTTRQKKQLLPKNANPWKPESGKKPYGIFNRYSYIRGACLADRWSSPLRIKPREPKHRSTENVMRRNTKKKWVYSEDRDLKSGVHRHGEGRWARIMQDFDFPERTATMLKDRWRTLKKQGKATT
ncbi:hypothetical protein AAFF_G00094150 [Aldrovandia affinis]|uniref:Telomeric repeat-binding factor n=1 Tax=Aldrovandia affinis TaxID=143900 RepID=A0AAD7T2V8_9TELE|nr:hypothetical protein AAFF_G00094150 [Aldrovandia affinis]